MVKKHTLKPLYLSTFDLELAWPNLQKPGSCPHGSAGCLAGSIFGCRGQHPSSWNLPQPCLDSDIWWNPPLRHQQWRQCNQPISLKKYFGKPTKNYLEDQKYLSEIFSEIIFFNWLRNGSIIRTHLFDVVQETNCINS